MTRAGHGVADAAAGAINSSCGCGGRGGGRAGGGGGGGHHGGVDGAGTPSSATGGAGGRSQTLNGLAFGCGAPASAIIGAMAPPLPRLRPRLRLRPLDGARYKCSTRLMRASWKCCERPPRRPRRAGRGSSPAANLWARSWARRSLIRTRGTADDPTDMLAWQEACQQADIHECVCS